MKKNTPVTISEMEVQVISDEELQALTGMIAGGAGDSSVCECTWWSAFEDCVDVDQ